jgi:hypothetical protein
LGSKDFRASEIQYAECAFEEQAMTPPPTEPAPLSDDELDAELARIEAMTPEELDSHIRAQGHDPKQYALEAEVIILKATIKHQVATISTLRRERDEAVAREGLGAEV